MPKFTNDSFVFIQRGLAAMNAFPHRKPEPLLYYSQVPSWHTTESPFAFQLRLIKGQLHEIYRTWLSPIDFRRNWGSDLFFLEPFTVLESEKVWEADEATLLLERIENLVASGTEDIKGASFVLDGVGCKLDVRHKGRQISYDYNLYNADLRLVTPITELLLRDHAQNEG